MTPGTRVCHPPTPGPGRHDSGPETPEGSDRSHPVSDEKHRNVDEDKDGL